MDSRIPARASSNPASLLARAQAGDPDALESLLAQARPRLRQWARGRLPGWARDVADTEDLLQDTLASATRHLASFEPDHEGAFHSYLRQIFVNRLRDEVRRAGRRPVHDTLSHAARIASGEQSPLSVLVGRAEWDRYERSLVRLPQRDREAVIARLELQYPVEDLAAAWKISPDAARKAVQRAVLRLAALMREDG